MHYQALLQEMAPAARDGHLGVRLRVPSPDLALGLGSVRAGLGRGLLHHHPRHERQDSQGVPLCVCVFIALPCDYRLLREVSEGDPMERNEDRLEH